MDKKTIKGNVSQYNITAQLLALKKNIALAYGKERADIANTLVELAYYDETATLLENIKFYIARCRDPDKSDKIKDI